MPRSGSVHLNCQSEELFSRVGYFYSCLPLRSPPPATSCPLPKVLTCSFGSIPTGALQDCRKKRNTAINGNANSNCSSNYKREKGLKLELRIVNKSKFCREDVGGFSWVLKVEVNSLLSFLVFAEPSSLPRERAFKKVSFLCAVLVLQPRAALQATAALPTRVEVTALLCRFFPPYTGVTTCLQEPNY